MRNGTGRRLGGVTLALGMGALVAGGGSPAGAAADAYAPCGGLTIKDPKGDATYYPTPIVGITSMAAQAPAQDIRQAYFTYRTGTDGKKHLRANLIIENLDGTIPAVEYADGVVYQVDFDTTDYNFATARFDGSEWSFAFESFTRPLADALPDAVPANPGTRTSVATTGEVVAGPQGVVSIEIPTDKIAGGFKPGDKFEEVNAHTYLDVPEFPSTIDDAPDENSTTTTYVVEECVDAAPAEPAPAQAPEVQAPAPATQEPASAPPAAQTQAAAPAPRTTAPAAAPKATKKKAKCKKAKKRAKGKKAKCKKARKKR